MKKMIKNIAIGLLLVFAAIQFTACGYEPVFYGIMHDVAPEEATVNGNITTIARCSINSEEYLVLSNGGSVTYKPVSSSKHGEWKTENIKLPFTKHHYNYFATSTEGEGHIGQQILKLIADETNLYLLTSSFRQDNEYGVVLPDQIYLWTCPLNSLFADDAQVWTDISKDSDLFPTSFDSSTSQLQMNFNLFFTNSPKPEHRKAFLSVTDSQTDTTAYYVLNGAAAPSTQDTTNYVKLYDQSKKINSAFYIGNTLYFSDSSAVTTNETSSADATLAYLAGVTANSNKNFDLFTYEGTGTPEQFIEIGSPIASLAFTADSILIGRGSYTSSYTSNAGIDRVLLDESGKPKKETSDFENNAKYQFTSAYIVMTLLNADPSKTEAQANLYATISYRGSGSSSAASFNNVGLWSYYPSRGNWNRE